MIIVNDRLQIQEQASTLPFFAFLTEGPNLARKHISIPDDVFAEMEAACLRRCLTMSKFISGGIQMALDDARGRFGEPANDVLPDRERDAPKPAKKPRQSPALVEAPRAGLLTTIRRGAVTWYDLVQMCSMLRVDPNDVLADIDPNDDLLDFDGKPWVDSTGFNAILDLCADEALTRPIIAWATTLH